jgi:hypothetical protein
MYDELYHHGIKGQKWGIRRFQNKDGSLTKRGEKRYEKQSAKPRGEYSLDTKYESITGEKKRFRKGGIRDALGAVGAGVAGLAAGGASLVGAKTALDYEGKPKQKAKALNAPGNMLRDTQNAANNMYRIMDDSMVRNAAKNAKKLDLSSATDADLRDYISRYRLEREFKSLTAEETRSGMEKTAQVLETIGSMAAVAGSVMGVIMTYKQLKGGHFSSD